MEEELELAQQKLHERELRIAELEADVGELTEARDAAQQQLSAVLIERDALRQAQDAALKRKRADEGASPVWRRNSQLGQNLADRDAKIRQLERLLKKCEKNLAKARQDAGKRLSGDGSHAPPAAHMQLQQQQQQEHPQPQADTLPAGAAAGSGGSGGATAAAVAAQPAAGVLAPGEPGLSSLHPKPEEGGEAWIGLCVMHEAAWAVFPCARPRHGWSPLCICRRACASSCWRRKRIRPNRWELLGACPAPSGCVGPDASMQHRRQRDACYAGGRDTALLSALCAAHDSSIP